MSAARRTWRLALGALVCVAALAATLRFVAPGARGAEPTRARAVESIPSPVDPSALELEPSHDTVSPVEADERTEGAAVVAAAVEAPADAAESRTTAPPELCVLYGSVTDVHGEPIVPWKPLLLLVDPAGSRLYVHADERGSYSLAGAAPGRYTWSCGTIGFLTRQGEIVLDRAAPRVRHDLVLERAVTLHIRVLTRDGRPWYPAARESGAELVDLLPAATAEPPGATLPEAAGVHNDNLGVGAFWDYGPIIDDLEPGDIGKLVLTRELPVYVSLVQGADVLETQRVEPGTGLVTFVLDPDALLVRQASVRARFVGADREQPLPGMVQIEPLNTFSQTDDGSWSETLPPGQHTLYFRATGYAHAELEVTLVAGQELDLGDVVLSPELTIEGRLLDADGRPVAGRLLVGKRDERGSLRFDHTRSHDTDRKGRYVVHGLEAGRYFLRTVGDDEMGFPGRKEPPTVWVSGNVEVSTLGGSVVGLDVHLVEGGVLLLTGLDKLPSGARCSVLDEHGDALRSRSARWGSSARLLLPPGSYTLAVYAEDDAELSRRALEIGAGTTEVDLGR